MSNFRGKTINVSEHSDLVVEPDITILNNVQIKKMYETKHLNKLNQNEDEKSLTIVSTKIPLRETKNIIPIGSIKNIELNNANTIFVTKCKIKLIKRSFYYGCAKKEYNNKKMHFEDAKLYCSVCKGSENSKTIPLFRVSI